MTAEYTVLTIPAVIRGTPGKGFEISWPQVKSDDDAITVATSEVKHGHERGYKMAVFVYKDNDLIWRYSDSVDQGRQACDTMSTFNISSNAAESASLGG